MKSLIKANGYNITIGQMALPKLSRFLTQQAYSSHIVLCDENTLRHCLPRVVMNCPLLADAEVIELEAGENSKSLENCEQVWNTLVELGAGKQTVVINLGGGVVCDAGGFCASVYKRGIDFVHVPTSLLAMADASVGGKTGINLMQVKNTIGTITFPKGVFIDPFFLQSLPDRHYLNGLAEVYKMALVSDKGLWRDLKEGNSVAQDLIQRSVSLKNDIVIRDPYDKGVRQALNFGHTAGHALEGYYAGEDLLHGEAVVMGMVIESHLAFQKKFISKKVLEEVTLVLGSVFYLHKISARANDLATWLQNDKKSTSTTARYSLIGGIGWCRNGIAAGAAELNKAITFYNTLAA